MSGEKRAMEPWQTVVYAIFHFPGETTPAHIDIIDRVIDIGCANGSVEDIGVRSLDVTYHAASPELLERWSEQVHNAWMAEKQRQGFADHVFIKSCSCDGRLSECIRCNTCQCGKKRDRHHADMVPFAQLSEATKEYDRATVRAVLTALVADDKP